MGKKCICMEKKKRNTSSSTFSSALRRTWLSGEAPSRWNHWSRISSGSESSCLTGTTKEPIGNAQLWESWRTTAKRGNVYLLCILHTHDWSVSVWPAYLNNQDVLSGVSNWETESLIPLRGSGPITHLQNRRIYATITTQTLHLKMVWCLTVVLWDSFPRVSSAPTFGSLPLFLSFQRKGRE